MALRSSIQKNYGRLLSSSAFWSKRQVFSSSSFLLGTNSSNVTSYNNNKNSTSLNSIAFFSTTTSKDDEDEDVTATHFRDGKPTLEYVTKQMPRKFSNMRNELIIKLAAEGIFGAVVEQVVRNIMVVDRIEYEEAKVVFEEIRKKNHELQWYHILPYHVGLAGTATISLGSIPLIFWCDTVKYFNDKYVTMEVPQPSELDTWLEVGSWSWSWMEPVIGELSFLLLCMQLGRSQLSNMGFKPYNNFSKDLRAKQIIKLYPQYDSLILTDYTNAVKYYSSGRVNKNKLLEKKN
eukprot:CAMPEP_0194133242 /NCGR_PEP_ID=MMETSP0152-20130528/3496_1 /TAXON_ID=1049557 /ORGANISM="Thalassiothrix antarctica, Strain L6-D1" /LENGTH=290 /DNA_ID=CAMNT_0038828521 /DNA_START=93 /DNA_END=965 /DNA_ORIENTATION=+